MILWFRHLPRLNIDLAEWNPFITNNWFREHFMKFVYLLQIIILLMPNFFYIGFGALNIFTLFLLGILILIPHELLHIIVINKKVNISLTFGGVFFWLHMMPFYLKLDFGFL